MKWQMVSRCLTSDWHRAAPADLLLVCNDADRYFKYADSFYSPLIDSVADIASGMGITCIRFSDRLSAIVGVDAYQFSFNINRQLLLFKLARKLTHALGFTESKVSRWFTIQESQLWHRILDKVQPKMVIGIQPTGPLCLACHQKSVAIYDLQHGIISDTPDNPYYFSGYRYAYDPQFLPSGFLCWDEDSKNILHEMRQFHSASKHVTGNPWFGRFADNHAEDRLVQMQRALLPKESDDKPIILVTLQYGLTNFAHDYVKDGVMADALNEAIKKTTKRYNWFLRLHPSQMVGVEKAKISAYLRQHFGSYESVSWRLPSTLPMPLLMATCQLHITHFSSAVIEASNFGMPSALLDPHIKPDGKHAEFFRQEIERDHAEVVALCSEAIIKFIERRLSHQAIERKSAYSQANMIKFLRRYLG